MPTTKILFTINSLKKTITSNNYLQFLPFKKTLSFDLKKFILLKNKIVRIKKDFISIKQFIIIIIIITFALKSMKEEKWKNKALHGQYPKILEKPHVDTVTTNKWLSSNLKGETEGLLVAAQDQAINTRNYQKVICGQQVESKCRMCSRHEETVSGPYCI